MNAEARRRGRRYGGLLTYVKDCFDATIIPTKNNRLLSIQVGSVVHTNVYMPYNGHPDETLYSRCLADLERLREQSSHFITSGDMNPTGDNLLAFRSFCVGNSLDYDRSVEWTFTEPRVLIQSLLDFCLIEQSPQIVRTYSETLLYTSIKGGDVLYSA